MATWITPGSSRSVKLDGARTRRHTIGLIPVSQNLTWRIASASAARFSVGTRGFGRRFMPPDYCLSASPSPDTPEILMLPRVNHVKRGEAMRQRCAPARRRRIDAAAGSGFHPANRELCSVEQGIDRTEQGKVRV